jgi:uncharacterized protein YggE
MYSTMLVAAFVMLLSVAETGAADVNETEDVPRLTVRGEALLQVPAERFRLRVGVVTESEKVERALEENTARMKEVISAMERTGLSRDDYKTSQFQIQPIWSPRPRQAPENWRSRITGYRVSNSLSVQTKKLKLAGRIIGAASDAGANSIDSIFFDLADPRAYRGEAISQATGNAIADAQSLAQAASVRLVRVLSLSLDNAVATPIVMRTEGFAGRAALAMDSTVPPISSGDVTVRASVTLVYEID